MASLNLNLTTGSSYRRINNATLQVGEIAGWRGKEINTLFQRHFCQGKKVNWKVLARYVFGDISWIQVMKGFYYQGGASASAGDAGDTGSITGSGRSPGGGHGNALQWILACRIPWTEEPGGLQSMGLQRVGHNLLTKQQHIHQRC